MRQLSILRADPIGALKVFGSFYGRAGPSLANQYVGKLGWIDTHLPRPFVVAFLASVLFVAATCGGEGPSLSRVQKAAILCDGNEVPEMTKFYVAIIHI